MKKISIFLTVFFFTINSLLSFAGGDDYGSLYESLDQIETQTKKETQSLETIESSADKQENRLKENHWLTWEEKKSDFGYERTETAIKNKPPVYNRLPVYDDKKKIERKQEIAEKAPLKTDFKNPNKANEKNPLLATQKKEASATKQTQVSKPHLKSEIQTTPNTSDAPSDISEILGNAVLYKNFNAASEMGLKFQINKKISLLLGRTADDEMKIRDFSLNDVNEAFKKNSIDYSYLYAGAQIDLASFCGSVCLNVFANFKAGWLSESVKFEAPDGAIFSERSAYSAFNNALSVDNKLAFQFGIGAVIQPKNVDFKIGVTLNSKPDLSDGAKYFLGYSDTLPTEITQNLPTTPGAESEAIAGKEADDGFLSEFDFGLYLSYDL